MTSYSKSYDLEALMKLESDGVVLSGVGETSGSINLNALIGKLQTSSGATATSTFTVSVKANNRWSNDTTFTVDVVKPTFKVSAYPGNIWTKEFTMNALEEDSVKTGDYSVISKNISYQYSSDGKTWTAMSSDLRKSGLTANTKYYIRGLYRGAVAGEVTELSTYPQTALENGSLDDYSVSGEDGSALKNYGAVYSWTGWATLNELTCDYCVGTAYAYNTRSGTRTAATAYSGTSAWIATIGWGYGGTIWSTKYQTPGELFLGTLTDVNHDKDTATKTYGISYESRPTALSFVYKYEPYNSDISDIFIQVCHDDDVLGSAELKQSSTVSSYTKATLNISYDNDKVTLKPNKLIVVFRSGTNTSVKNYGSSGSNGVRYVGSVLTVDDISLVYGK
jgi:hypothetical protein